MRRKINKFTRDQDERIIAYYNIPEGQEKPSRIEFAKSINHSSRSVKERYEKYLSSCRIFTKEECDQLVQYAKTYHNSWETISRLFNGKFSNLVLRDQYIFLMKKNERNQNKIRKQNKKTINDDSNNSSDVDADFWDENTEIIWVIHH